MKSKAHLRTLKQLEIAINALNFVEKWALENTPKIRPYDLIDRVVLAFIKIKKIEKQK